MKKIFLLISTTIMMFTSCNVKERVIYFQDFQDKESITTQVIDEITFQPGDRLRILVTSSLTPEDAMCFNLSTSNNSASAMNNTNNSPQYTVSSEGTIEVAGVGTVVAQGKTRSQLTQEIQNRLRNGLLNDAIVTITPSNQYINILGEVKSPHRFSIDRDNLTLLEAIAMAGDLTIQGDRSNVIVMRNENGVITNYHVDLRSKDVLSSPVYHLQANDVVYVQPNNVKSNQYINNGNSIRQISTWLSLLSFITTTIILIKNW